MLQILALPYVNKQYKPNKNINFRGSDSLNKICADTFVKNSDNIGENFSKRIRELLPQGFESKTLEQLFTPKFRLKENPGEYNIFMTTVIERATGNPAELIIEKDKDDNLFCLYDSKNEVGYRLFGINPDTKQIEAGYMTSEYNKLYAGVGIREHQIAVETAMMNGFDTINIDAAPYALTFHKKCLFTDKENVTLSYPEFYSIVQSLMSYFSLSKKYILNTLPFERDKDNIILLQKKMFEKHPQLNNTIKHFMELKGERLELWKDMARSQPILLS